MKTMRKTIYIVLAALGPVSYTHLDVYKRQDLGIPYMEKAETILDPKYTRGTLADVYSKIDADLIEGLPLITDEFYSVPKYHFNQKAEVRCAWRTQVRTRTAASSLSFRRRRCV